MKTPKLMLSVLCSAVVAAAMSVSCSEISMMEIDAPDDLQSRIDEIAEANKKDTGDTTYVMIANAIVGAEDCSSGWWTEFSDYFPVPSNKLLHLEFVNHGSGANNWNNWNLCLAKGQRDSDGYSEYFVLRSDAYGWGNGDYNGALIAMDYQDIDGDGDIWNDFRANMEGAFVEMDIDHSISGYAFVTATMTSKDGSVVMTETYNHPVSSDEFNAFIICDGSWFEMKNAYLIPSKVAAVADQQPVSIVAAGYPAALEIGDEDFWGEAVATVTFEDGSVAVAEKEDITFTVVPDLTTTGMKTVVYSYSKTKQGNYGKSVNNFYNIEVTNPVVALEAVANVNVIGNAKYATLSDGAFKVEATYSDGSKSLLAPSQFSVAFTDGKFVYEAAEGTVENVATITYTTASGKAIEAAANLVIAKSANTPQAGQVGASDFSTGWWVPEGFSNEWHVAPYTSETVTMMVGSDNLGNWHSPCTALRAADLTEYAVVREDHYGWGDGYATVVANSNWNWDTFMSNINGSEITITVTNCGDNTANIRYHVIYANGEEHFQYYDNLGVNSSDLNFCNIVEEAYLNYL